METTIIHQPTFLILAILTVSAGLIVVPYTLTSYNARWMPRWICPDSDYLSRTFQYYYPAQESRVSLAVALFAGAFIAATYIVYIGDIVRADSILLFYAALMPTYLLHRILCFHKLNEFTPVQQSEDTNSLNVYRIWKVVLLWFTAAAVWMADMFRILPLHVLGFFTLATSASAIFAHFIEINRGIRENRETWKGKNMRKIFLELMPGSYYLAFALSGMGLTQAALWLQMPLLLIGWVLLVVAFTIAEYHFRFVSPYRTDAVEQWGEVPYLPLYTAEEELWMIRRRDEALLRHSNATCWVVITESAASPGHHRVQLTANLEYKQREIGLRREKLLYIRWCRTVDEARRYTRTIDTGSLIDKKIRALNPAHDDLNRQSVRALSFLNTMI